MNTPSASLFSCLNEKLKNTCASLFSTKRMNGNYLSLFTPVWIGDKKQSVNLFKCHLRHQMYLPNHQHIKLLHCATIFSCFLLFWITEKNMGIKYFFKLWLRLNEPASANSEFWGREHLSFNSKFCFYFRFLLKKFSKTNLIFNESKIYHPRFQPWQLLKWQSWIPSWVQRVVLQTTLRKTKSNLKHTNWN